MAVPAVSEAGRPAFCLRRSIRKSQILMRGAIEHNQVLENTSPNIQLPELLTLLDTAHFWCLDFPHIRANEPPIDPSNRSSGQIFGSNTPQSQYLR